jgi:hypothetical protein
MVARCARENELVILFFDELVVIVWCGNDWGPFIGCQVYCWTNWNWTPGFELEMARPWLILDFGLFCNFETLED